MLEELILEHLKRYGPMHRAGLMNDFCLGFTELEHGMTQIALAVLVQRGKVVVDDDNYYAVAPLRSADYDFDADFAEEGSD